MLLSLSGFINSQIINHLIKIPSEIKRYAAFLFLDEKQGVANDQFCIGNDSPREIFSELFLRSGSLASAGEWRENWKPVQISLGTPTLGLIFKESSEFFHRQKLWVINRLLIVKLFKIGNLVPELVVRSRLR